MSHCTREMLSGDKLRNIAPAPSGRVLAIFGNAAHVRWLRFLKPGFRHCFLAINDGRTWLTFDPLAHRIEIGAPDLPPHFDLAAWYRAYGHRVVETRFRPVRRTAAPFGPFTCVEAVKRTLGLHRRWILTPWQLYRYLMRDNSYFYIK